MSEKNAVISTGGKQFLVKVDDIVIAEKINQEPDSVVEFIDELDQKTKVTAKIIEQGRAAKVSGRIFRNKTRSSRFARGHRQLITKLKIEKIG